MAKQGGRQKGAKNKKTIEALNRAEKIIAIIEAGDIEADILRLTPRERMGIYSDMLEYTMPKLARTELHGEIEVSGGVNIYVPDNGRDSEDATGLHK